MKKALLFLIAALPLCVFSQPTPQISLTAGDELIKAKNHYQLGASLLITGAMIAIIPAFSDSLDMKTEISATGGLVSLIGLILTIESFSHIGKAGKKLNEKGIGFIFNEYGIGVRYHFGNFKKRS